MANPTIRRADREDAGAVLELITALAHYEKLDPPDATAMERLVADGWGDSPRFESWLAEVEGRAVGYALFFETYSTFLAQPTMYLEDLFLLPEYRGRGIGEALFRRVAELVVERGYGRLEWVCLDWNEVGQRFYEKIGASHDKEWLRYRLLPEQISE